MNAGTQWITGNRTAVKHLHIYGSTDLDNIRFSRIHLLMETNVNFGDIKYHHHHQQHHRRRRRRRCW